MPATRPLITTRFSPPRISSHAVLRTPLLSRLLAAHNCRLTLINGSAGFGKTTLLAQWRQSLLKEGSVVVWLSLSQEDAKLESFCANLIGALQQAGLPLEDDLLLLIKADSQNGLLALASVMINTLARTNTTLYLMVDDFQFATDPAISQLMQIVVDSAPPLLHVVLASRVFPDLKLGRLRAMAELCEINGTDLGFSFDESLAFLKSYLDEDIDLDLAHTIHASTDGWPIGLQMMSISLKTNPRKGLNSDRLLSSKAGLVDYLVEDVISDLPAATMTFLEQISILRRFNVKVASEVSQSCEAAALIANIEARNLFIVPMDMECQHPWYRLHPLFAEFLQQRLIASDTDRQALHLRASAWFEQAGIVNEAVYHAIQSENFESLVALLERSQPDQHNISHLGQFVRWLDCVPLERLVQHPGVLLQGAWGCVLTMMTSKAQAWIDALEQSSHDEAHLGPHIALVRASIAIQQDDLTLCEQLVQRIRDHRFNHPFNEQMRACLYVHCLNHSGRQQEAWDYINGPEARAIRASQDEVALLAVVTAAHGAMLSGNVREASRHIVDVLLVAESTHGRRSISASCCGVGVAEAHYEMDRIDDARQILSNRLNLLHLSPPEITISAMLSVARLTCLQESPASALAYLANKATGLRAQGFDRAVAYNLAEQIRILLGNGDWRQCESQRAALEALAHRHDGDSPTADEITAVTHLSRARTSLARQEPDRAIVALDSLEQLAARYGRGIWKVQSQLLRAVALNDLGLPAQAQTVLRQVVAESFRMGLVRTLLDEGTPLLLLLANLDCEDDPVLESYRKRLVAAPLSFATASAVTPRAATESGVSDSSLFTRREMEIITLLEQAMSNKRMAQTLNLSQETIKWNLKNIYAKLGVSGRYEALIAARQRMEQ
ncbi:HTH-type transcriptional regulator MalT [compost metagenome]